MSCYSLKAKPKPPPRININKKLPPNPKYDYVRPLVDTGKSLSQCQEILEQLRRNFKHRKEEIFKRINVTTFVQLVLQVYQLKLDIGDVNSDDGVSDVDVAKGDIGEEVYVDGAGDGAELASARSTLSNVIHGIGELDVSGGGERPGRDILDVGDDDIPYLILDVREGDEYEQGHIITAKSFPTSMLSRYNGETTEIRQYKNSPGKIIILYDHSEKLVVAAATTMVQRGFENVFVLSGGLQVASQLFPCGLITGHVPQPPASSRPLPTSQPLHEPHKTVYDQHDLGVLEETLMSLLLPGGRGGGGSRAGSGVGSRAGSRAGSGIGSRAGSGIGSRAGSGIGSRAGSGIGSRAGSGIGSRAGSIAGSGIESRAGSGIGSRRAGSGLATRPDSGMSGRGSVAVEGAATRPKSHNPSSRPWR